MRLLSPALALTLGVASFAQPQPKAVIDWKAQLPAVEAALRTLPTTQEPTYPVRIRQEMDLTGDETTEALVATGSGGAYTDEYILMRMEGDRPVIAQLKEANGKIGPASLWEGSSVMHGIAAELHPEHHAVLQVQWDLSDRGKLQTCKCQAYRWVPQTQLFEFNKPLSDRLTRDFCRGMPDKLYAPPKRDKAKE